MSGRLSARDPQHSWCGTCPVTGKRRFTSQKAAKAAARSMGDSMSAYRCDACPGLWHLGHLPRQVIRGRAPRPSAPGGY